MQFNFSTWEPEQKNAWWLVGEMNLSSWKIDWEPEGFFSHSGQQTLPCQQPTRGSKNILRNVPLQGQARISIHVCMLHYIFPGYHFLHTVHMQKTMSKLCVCRTMSFSSATIKLLVVLHTGSRRCCSSSKSSKWRVFSYMAFWWPVHDGERERERERAELYKLTKINSWLKHLCYSPRRVRKMEGSTFSGFLATCTFLVSVEMFLAPAK